MGFVQEMGWLGRFVTVAVGWNIPGVCSTCGRGFQSKATHRVVAAISSLHRLYADGGGRGIGPGFTETYDRVGQGSSGSCQG